MGGGSGAIIPTMATTTANRRSQPQRIPATSSFQSPFGPAPTKYEVDKAMSDLTRVMKGFDAACIEIDERAKIVHQSHSVDSSSLMKSSSLTLDAFHLLQSDAEFKKIVVSISSDVGVWDSVVTNEAVQDLHSSLPQTANEETAASYTQERESASQIIKWIFSFMKSGITELIEKIECYVFDALKFLPKNKNTKAALDDLLEEKVRSSFFLSILVLVIVIVTRSLENS